MHKILFIVGLSFLSFKLNSQTIFTHVTTTSNTSAHMTLLDNTMLDRNPGAAVFVTPVWEQTGDQNPTNVFGVWYNGTKWTIFNQNRSPIPATAAQHLRFNVLAFPSTSPKVFVHTVTAANLGGHITTLDHALLNNNPSAIIMVTQRYGGGYNNHEIGVWYENGRWKIFNQDRAALTPGLQFNVLIANDIGLNSGAFQHTHTASTQLAAPNVGYTVLHHPNLNGSKDWHIFVTQRWIGAYNPYTYNVWYDRPDDAYKQHQDNRWMIYNSQGQQMPLNAAFNVLAIPFNWQGNPDSDFPRVCIDRIPTQAPEGALQIVTLHGTYWRTGETIRIMMTGGTERVRERVRFYANKWLEHANLRFDFVSTEPADIHIAFTPGEGSWSYVGTYSRLHNPSMNFGWLTDASPEAEFSRVVLHEFGHALGAIHEHQHPEVAIPWDREAVYRYYGGPPNRWSRADIDHNIFERYSHTETNFTAYDSLSIMHYPISDDLTIGRFSVPWNTSLSENDKAHMRVIYPFPVALGNPKLRVTIKTGNDDLRTASQAYLVLKLRVSSAFSRILHFPLNRGAAWASNSINTMEASLPVNTIPADIFECMVTFKSGQTSVFSTGDNWNMDQLKVEMIYPTNTVLLKEQTGAPIMRFTQTRGVYNVPLR